MIEVSIYYLIGSVVILPSITLYFTRRYYKNYIVYYKKLIKNLNNDKTQFERNRDIIDNFFKQQIN